MEPVRINYNMMDVVKYLSSILLVCAHTASERVSLPPMLDLCCSVYIITVPFFFIASSFLFFRKLESLEGSDRKTCYWKYTKRIGLMYLAWSIIYFCFVLTSWIQSQASLDIILSYMHHSIVFSTYSTIWFLPALWVGVTLVYVLHYKLKCSIGFVIAISLFLYLFSSIEYNYHSVNSILHSINNGYKSIFVTWRNGFFNAFIFTAIGCYLSQNNRLNIVWSLLGSCFFGIGFLIEAFVLKRLVPSADANFLILLVPFSYFFFDLVCSIKLPDSKIYVPLRKMSMLIFVSQRLFLSAIPSVVASECISGAWDLFDNGIIALFVVVVEVSLFSYMIMVTSKKVSVFKYLM